MVARRGGQAAVAEQRLDDAEVGTALQQVGGEAMPQCMHRDALAEAGRGACRTAGGMQHDGVDRMLRITPGKQPVPRRYACGRVSIVRYADDFVMGFESEVDARQMLVDLKERLAKFGLTLHEDKTDSSSLAAYLSRLHPLMWVELATAGSSSSTRRRASA